MKKSKVLVKSLPNRKLKNKKVLLIEDIVDSGQEIIRRVVNKKFEDIKVWFIINN